MSDVPGTVHSDAFCFPSEQASNGTMARITTYIYMHRDRFMHLSTTKGPSEKLIVLMCPLICKSRRVGKQGDETGQDCAPWADLPPLRSVR